MSEPLTWGDLKEAIEQHGVDDDTLIDSITIAGGHHQLHVEVTEHDVGPQRFTVTGSDWPVVGV